MRMWLALGAVITCGSVVSAITPDEVDRAAKKVPRGMRAVIKKLAGEKLAGRDNGTQGSLDAQAYLIKKLRRLGEGLNGGGTSDDAYKQPFTHLGESGTNLLAVMPGTDLANEYVMIGAHYDHLDSRSDGSGACDADGAPGGATCNGAADNASGVAATLAIARMLDKIGPPRRSVILAFWDAEEDELNGSAYYAANPLVPNAAVKGYINFDIQGADLLPSLKTFSFAVGAETGGDVLELLVADAIASEGLETQLLSFIFGQLRSDYVNLVNVGIPTVFFTDANNGCWHTVNDDVKYLNGKKLSAQTRIAWRTAVALAETSNPPAFAGPNPMASSYADLVHVAEAVERSQADLALFSPADQAIVMNVHATLQGLVANGEAAYDAAAVTATLNGAVDMVNAFRRVPCQKF